MDLQTLWFIIITFLFIGFFVLEGFDFGVGILLPFISRDDRQRRTIINTIGPFWDGNEVWLITATSGMLAAFPDWYATLFSALYLPVMMMLVALIFRGIAFEFRSKRDNPAWRSFWDWSIFGGSVVPALLWGIALANFIRGVPVDGSMHYTGGLLNLLNPYALLCGITATLIFTLHGAIFLTLKTTGVLHERAMEFAKKLWAPATLLCILFMTYTTIETDLFRHLGVNPGIIPVFSVLALISVLFLLQKNAAGWAFAMTSVAIAFSTITIFMGLYPRLLVSSLNPAWSLTIYNSSSSAYSLGLVSVVALVFLPIIIMYQGWSYWVFRQRVTVDSELEY